MKSHKKKIRYWNTKIAFFNFSFYLSLSSQEIAHVFETEEVTLHDPKETNKYYFSLLPVAVSTMVITLFDERIRESYKPEWSLGYKIEEILKENKMSDAAFWGSFNTTVYDNRLFNLAFGEGVIDCARLYLAHKKNPSDLGGEYAQSPLNIALFAKQSEVACLLIEAGADPNQKDNEITPYPVCAAAQNNDALCVRLLLEKGANKNLERALQWAAHHNSLEIVNLLLAVGADPNNVNGLSALIEAVGHRNIPMVQSLLKHGVKIDPTSYYLRYALRRAQEDGNDALVSLFKNAGYPQGKV